MNITAEKLMPTVTLPDGKTLNFNQPTTVQQVAETIGAGLAKAAIAGKVDGKLVDTSFLISRDAKVQIITERDPEGLEVLRHSCAHLMAQAVQALFPGTQVTIGPVIEDGFYYDFATTNSIARSFTPEDLTAIEKKMLEISNAGLSVHRKILDRKEAIQVFQQKREQYKVEIIESIPGEEPLSFYQQGDWIDLCRGPHVPNTNKIKVFKLTKVAGAYWRGDPNNEMLQRIYGTAWFSEKDLKTYLHRLEEAEKRDHRKLAKRFHWFHMKEEDPGMVFWHPAGFTIYRIIENYIRTKVTEHGYQEIKTPQLLDKTLWEKSGHWANFRKNMFTLQADEHDYALKPMNCPGHIQVFNQGIKSYRDLPLRFAEFGSCHRYEPSGALHGIMRVRSFVQDDGHILCTDDQIQEEAAKFNRLLFEVYKDFGFNEVIVKLATRPAERVGSDESWDKAEKALEQALNEAGLKWQLSPGEGAFYGPKIEYSLKDCMGRIWQCGTLQVDPSMPERLGAEYVAEDGSRKTPIMLHRAIIGTLERFIGILMEETAGAFPAWLAPVQAVVLNITDSQAQYAQELEFFLRNFGFRVKSDLRNEKINFKIREHTLQKIPYLLVVGDREVQDRKVSVRSREGVDLGVMSIEEFVGKLGDDVLQLGRKIEL